MAVIPLVLKTGADHQSTSIETGGRGFHLVIHARFFYRNFDTSAVNPRAFRPYLDFG